MLQSTPKKKEHPESRRRVEKPRSVYGAMTTGNERGGIFNAPNVSFKPYPLSIRTVPHAVSSSSSSSREVCRPPLATLPSCLFMPDACLERSAAIVTAVTVPVISSFALSLGSHDALLAPPTCSWCTSRQSPSAISSYPGGAAMVSDVSIWR